MNAFALCCLFAVLLSCSDKIVVQEKEEEEEEEEVVVDSVESDPPMTHQLVPDTRGRLDFSAEQAGKILPGDIIYLRGRFLSVRIIGLKGSEAKPIRVMNYPGETLIVGDKSWSGGGYSNAIQLLRCQHVVLGGEKDASDFQIEGSTDPKGQTGFIGISLQPFTDHVEVKNVTIRNGAVGIMSKTDPVQTDSSTWYPATWLENLSIHDVTILDVYGEGMYIGHSSIYWGWDENGKGYNAGAEPNNPAHTFVRPVMWRNVKIYNNEVKGSGWDGIQVSSADRLEIHGNEVSDFGTRGTSGQCMGILVGGNSMNTNTHDNYVHDGHGDSFQFHGTKGNNSTHAVHNNLFVNTRGSGLGLYGLVDDATIDIYNNTLAGCYSFAVLANGRGKNILVNLKDNLYIACYLQQPELMNKYIRTMNNAVVKQVDDKAFYSVEEAAVNPSNDYSPLPGSPVGKAGYRRSPR